MLDMRGVVKKFGGLVAVNNVDFHVREKEILGLVGPNGAGKTTLINLIAGVYPSDNGTILYRGENISNLDLHQRCRKGIAKTFQNPTSFPGLTAAENVMVGLIFGNGHSIGKREARDEAIEILDYVGLPAEKADKPVSSLNLIEMKRTQLARALASKPDLLLLDELVTGLNPREINEAMELIIKIRENGVTILLIEHVMRVIMGVSERIFVMDQGERIAEGSPEEIIADPHVIESYLGKKYAR